MAHKTFISYKYSESHFIVIEILMLWEMTLSSIRRNIDSPNLTDTTTENIKNHLKQMIYDTTVTIIVLFAQHASEQLDRLKSAILSKHLTGWSLHRTQMAYLGLSTILWKL